MVILFIRLLIIESSFPDFTWQSWSFDMYVSATGENDFQETTFCHKERLLLSSDYSGNSSVVQNKENLAAAFFEFGNEAAVSKESLEEEVEAHV